MEGYSQHIAELYRLWYAGKATEEERQELLQLLESADIEGLLSPLMKDAWKNTGDAGGLSVEARKELAARIIASYPADTEKHNRPSTGFVRRLGRNWIRYAAAAVAVIAIGYFWTGTRFNNESSDNESGRAEIRDIAPGGNRALLTLADGTAIVLDSASNGLLAKQGVSAVVKKDGQVIYDVSSSTGPASAAMYNTMHTPRGGQYRLSLPDGTRVWLNAASSITYPTSFSGNERRVSMSGEAYFEVSKDRKRPFLVKVNNDIEIEVLGTHFNINGYTDENAVKATLLEGSVRVARMDAATGAVTLQPGQQARITETVKLSESVNLEQVMAWKNGLFSFKKADLRTVMRELARWYDLEVEYIGAVPDRVFSGEIGRGLTLRQVLDGLSQSRIRYVIDEHNKIRIMAEATK